MRGCLAARASACRAAMPAASAAAQLAVLNSAHACHPRHNVKDLRPPTRRTRASAIGFSRAFAGWSATGRLMCGPSKDRRAMCVCPVACELWSLVSVTSRARAGLVLSKEEVKMVRRVYRGVLSIVTPDDICNPVREPRVRIGVAVRVDFLASPRGALPLTPSRGERRGWWLVRVARRAVDGPGPPTPDTRPRCENIDDCTHTGHWTPHDIST
jgi:hypothetical protein